MINVQNFIGGEFVNPQAGAFFDNYDPARGLVYGKTPDSDAVDVVHAISAARNAFEKWSALHAKDRAQFLIKIADRLEEKIQEFALAESRDVGKPLWLTREVDLPRTIQNFRYFAAKIASGGESLMIPLEDRAIQYARQEPLGVAGLISPWNLPLYTLTFKIAPALAVGNTAVCKPSELTPVTAWMLAQVMADVGLPAGVCNFVFGRGETAGATLVQHPGVPLLSFTGGTETAEKIQAAAAPKMKRISLELGGKNANIILKDADLKKAVPMTVRSSFLNSGQICLCGSRIYIQDEIYDEFMAEFKKATQEIVIGDPSDPKTFMGPMVSAKQREITEAAIRQARSENAQVVVGGARPKNLPTEFESGYFHQPTIIEDLSNCSDLWDREIFGPVVTVKKFKYPHEAIKWTNTSSYGLSASLWTNDISRAHKLAAQIQAGTVWVNTWGLRDVRMPFGGYKSSGVGREGGDHSLQFFTETKTVCVANN